LFLKFYGLRWIIGALHTCKFAFSFLTPGKAGVGEGAWNKQPEKVFGFTPEDVHFLI